MTDRHEIAKNYCSAAQSLAWIAAIAIAGIWTFQVFKAERRVDAADPVQPTIRFDLSTRQMSIPGEDGYVLAVTVGYRNEGRKDTHLSWGEQPLTITLVRFDKEGLPRYERVASVGAYTVSSSGVWNVLVEGGVRHGGAQELAFIVKLKNPGLYLLSFRADATPDHILQKAGREGDFPVFWSVNHYVVVE